MFCDGLTVVFPTKFSEILCYVLSKVLFYFVILERTAIFNLFAFISFMSPRQMLLQCYLLLLSAIEQIMISMFLNIEDDLDPHTSALIRENAL